MRRISFPVVFLFLLIGLPDFCLATVYVIRPDGTGDFPVIQAAVDFAQDGDVIELTDGVFTGAGNRDVDYLGKAITICSQSGDANSCIIDCEGSASSEHCGFLFVLNEGPGSRLIGIMVCNAYTSSGGGLYFRDYTCTHSPGPTIERCAFVNNFARHYGGAFDCAWSSPSFIDCRFEGNRANEDGGVYRSMYSDFAFIRCEFIDNAAPEGAGGVCSSSGGSAHFAHCDFIENQATFAGAMDFIGTIADFDDCNFLGNAAEHAVGAVHTSGALDVVHCTFADNTAGWHAGAVDLSYSSSGQFEDCTFVRNASDEEEGGSAIAYQESHSTLRITNCIFAFQQGPRPPIEETRFGEGRAIPEVYCCDIFGNEGGDWVGRIAEQYGVNGNISEDPLFCDYPGGDYTLSCVSPCAPENNPDCGQIGAWPVGCGASPAHRTTWGAIKEMFR